MTVDEKLDLIISKLDAIAASGGKPDVPSSTGPISIAEAKAIKANDGSISYALDVEANEFTFSKSYPFGTQQWKQPWNGQ